MSDTSQGDRMKEEGGENDEQHPAGGGGEVGAAASLRRTDSISSRGSLELSQTSPGGAGVGGSGSAVSSPAGSLLNLGESGDEGATDAPVVLVTSPPSRRPPINTAPHLTDDNITGYLRGLSLTARVNAQEIIAAHLQPSGDRHLEHATYKAIRGRGLYVGGGAAATGLAAGGGGGGAEGGGHDMVEENKAEEAGAAAAPPPPVAAGGAGRSPLQIQNKELKDFIIVTRNLCWMYDGFGHDEVYPGMSLEEVSRLFREPTLSENARRYFDHELSLVGGKLSDSDAKHHVERLCSQLSTVLGLPFFLNASAGQISFPITGTRQIVDALLKLLREQLTVPVLALAGKTPAGVTTARVAGAVEEEEAEVGAQPLRTLIISLDSVTGSHFDPIIRQLCEVGTNIGLLISPATLSDPASVSPYTFKVTMNGDVGSPNVLVHFVMRNSIYADSVRGVPFAKNTILELLSHRTASASAQYPPGEAATLALGGARLPLAGGATLPPITQELYTYFDNAQSKSYEVTDSALVSKIFEISAEESLNTIVTKEGTSISMIRCLVNLIRLGENERVENNARWVQQGGAPAAPPERTYLGFSGGVLVAVVRYIHTNDFDPTKVATYVAGLKTDGDDCTGRSVSVMDGPQVRTMEKVTYDGSAATLTTLGAESLLNPKDYVHVHVTIDEIAGLISNAFHGGTVIMLSKSMAVLRIGSVFEKADLDSENNFRRELLGVSKTDTGTATSEEIEEARQQQVFQQLQKLTATNTAIRRFLSGIPGSSIPSPDHAEGGGTERGEALVLPPPTPSTRYASGSRFLLTPHGKALYKYVVDNAGLLLKEAQSNQRRLMSEAIGGGVHVVIPRGSATAGGGAGSAASSPSAHSIDRVSGRASPTGEVLSRVESAGSARSAGSKGGRNRNIQPDNSEKLTELFLALMYQELLDVASMNLRENVTFTNPLRMLSTGTVDILASIYQNTYSFLTAVTNFNNSNVLRGLQLIAENPSGIELADDSADLLKRISRALYGTDVPPEPAPLVLGAPEGASGQPHLPEIPRVIENKLKKLKPVNRSRYEEFQGGLIHERIRSVTGPQRTQLELAKLQILTEQIEYFMTQVKNTNTSAVVAINFPEPFTGSLTAQARSLGSGSENQQAFRIYLLFRRLGYDIMSSRVLMDYIINKPTKEQNNSSNRENGNGGGGKGQAKKAKASVESVLKRELQSLKGYVAQATESQQNEEYINFLRKHSGNLGMWRGILKSIQKDEEVFYKNNKGEKIPFNQGEKNFIIHFFIWHDNLLSLNGSPPASACSQRTAASESGSSSEEEGQEKEEEVHHEDEEKDIYTFEEREANPALHALGFIEAVPRLEINQLLQYVRKQVGVPTRAPRQVRGGDVPGSQQAAAAGEGVSAGRGGDGNSGGCTVATRLEPFFENPGAGQGDKQCLTAQAATCFGAACGGGSAKAAAARAQTNPGGLTDKQILVWWDTKDEGNEINGATMGLVRAVDQYLANHPGDKNKIQQIGKILNNQRKSFGSAAARASAVPKEESGFGSDAVNPGGFTNDQIRLWYNISISSMPAEMKDPTYLLIERYIQSHSEQRPLFVSRGKELTKSAGGGGGGGGGTGKGGARKLSSVLRQTYKRKKQTSKTRKGKRESKQRKTTKARKLGPKLRTYKKKN